MLVPLVVGAIIGNLPYFGFRPVNPRVEIWYLRGYFVFAAIAYMNWAVVTINKICAFLDINCLTIKTPQHGQRKPNGTPGPQAKRFS